MAKLLHDSPLVARIDIQTTPADPEAPRTGVSFSVEFERPLQTDDLKHLLTLEHLFNTLPSRSRMHVHLQELPGQRRVWMAAGEASSAAMAVAPILPFRHGRRYRITYKIPGVWRKARICVATFMGEVDGVLQWNLRPAAGTATIERAWIESAEEVSANLPHQAPRRV